MTLSDFSRLADDESVLPIPELAMAHAKLDRLYKVNRPAFNGVASTIDVWLKQSAKPGEADETPVEPIQQDSPKKREVA